MIRVTTLVIWGDLNDNQILRSQFEDKVPSPFKAWTHISLAYLQISLLEGSPELDELLKLCEQKGLRLQAFSDTHYSKRELEQCEFFRITPPYPTELDGVNLKSFGNVYEGACPVCGVGGILHGNVLIDRKYPKKYKMGIIQPELYMSGEVKALVEENGLTGLSFKRKMMDYKGREIADFYVPDFSSILPPMSDTSWLVSDGFKKPCGHGITYLRSDIQYERDKLSDAKDFNLTQEYIDNWMIREVVVSARARKVLQQNKISCRYTPVHLI